MFGLDIIPAKGWCHILILYQFPMDKWTGDLHWRIVHRAVATNRHVVHFNPRVGVGCPFCSETESIFHLFVQRTRLGSLFSLLSNWFSSLGEVFTFQLFKIQLKVGQNTQFKGKRLSWRIVYLVPAELAIWKTRNNKLAWQDAVV